MQNFDHEKIIKIFSEKGKEKILYRGFSYNLRKKGEIKDLWRCRHNGCSAFLHTSPEDEVIKFSYHNHEPNFEKNRVEYGVKAMISRAEVTSERARDVILGVIQDFNNGELAILPQIESLTDKIKRLRNSKHKNTITQQSDIPLSIRNLKSGEVFLQFDSGINDDNRIVVFCTNKDLSRLESSKIILMDGTFKSSPTGFKQLYTLVVFFMENIFP